MNGRPALLSDRPIKQVPSIGEEGARDEISF